MILIIEGGLLIKESNPILKYILSHQGDKTSIITIIILKYTLEVISTCSLIMLLAKLF